jgi:hypothetical protein
MVGGTHVTPGAISWLTRRRATSWPVGAREPPPFFLRHHRRPIPHAGPTARCIFSHLCFPGPAAGLKHHLPMPCCRACSALRAGSPAQRSLLIERCPQPTLFAPVSCSAHPISCRQAPVVASALPAQRSVSNLEPMPASDTHCATCSARRALNSPPTLRPPPGQASTSEHRPLPAHAPRHQIRRCAPHLPPQSHNQPGSRHM